MGLGKKYFTLLGTPFMFNLAFYAVVPLIAIVLSGDYRLGATAIGLVLGVRTFMQQGMFLFGGMLGDKFGPRAVILVGCLVRVSGFFSLSVSAAMAPDLLWLFVLGTVLTGLGGALFTPGMNMLVAAEDQRRPKTGKRRATLFAWYNVAGEIGTVLGPLIGHFLLGWGFKTVAAAGGVMFLVIAAILWFLLPGKTDTKAEQESEPIGWGVFRDRRFVAFAAIHSVDLLAYNQLYLTLPLTLDLAEAPASTTGAMFSWLSILTFAIQMPLANLSARIGVRHALSSGYLATATGFLILAINFAIDPSRSWTVIAVFAAVTMLGFGHLTAQPTAMSAVPTFAGQRPTGAYYGLLSTSGGFAVLIGNLVIGSIFEATATRTFGSSAAWLVLVAWLCLSALAMRVLLDPRRAHSVGS